MQSSSRQPRKWTLAEDQLLREEVEAQSQSQARQTAKHCRLGFQYLHLADLYLLVIGSGDVKDWYENS